MNSVQEKLYKGYAKAALKLGQQYDLYRPTAADYPVAPAQLVATVMASFNPQDMKYGSAGDYAKPGWYCLTDGRLTKVGDYLVNGAEVYFIAAQQLALPIDAVRCNRVATVTRPKQQSGAGAQGYGGSVVADEVALMTQWPCSILQGTKGEKTEANLPADIRSPWWAILLPAWPGVVLRSTDVITDDLGRRYTVSSAELTDRGWRLTAMQAQT
ncbi:hypothetical protein GJ699_02580 [Duganella sp. FT80W]|uniref:Uncharacterized protein n=1 Tax=Duganella guangzhouensis TaxID=2666084 RepID=A0A6I2KWS3_9BURK|nr:hypothetical protein [Duganella guangzhouensis]MRW88864.1 hypothetical protein [Duganella guangzhouensis]